MLDRLIIATDSQEIFDAVTAFGGEALMTSPLHRAGTERVAEAASSVRGIKADIIINIQGDEPLLSPSAIDAVAREMVKHPRLQMATIATSFRDESELADPGNAKVVLDSRGNALYFSRAVIPFPRDPYHNYLKHVGLYGYRSRFLQRYVTMQQTPAELAEKLEQLRVLEHGIPIRVIIGKYTSIGVDTAADLARVRRLLHR